MELELRREEERLEDRIAHGGRAARETPGVYVALLAYEPRERDDLREGQEARPEAVILYYAVAVPYSRTEPGNGSARPLRDLRR